MGLSNIVEKNHIRRIVSQLTSNERRNTVIKNIIEELRKIFDADNVIFYEYYEPKQKVYFPVLAGEFIDKSKLVDRAVKYNYEAVKNIIKNRRSYFAEESTEDSTMTHKHLIKNRPKEDCFTFREKIQSSCAVIIRDEDSIHGLLFYNYRRNVKFTRELKYMMRIMSSYVAVAQNFRQKERLAKSITFSFKEANKIRLIPKVGVGEEPNNLEGTILKQVLKDILVFFEEKKGYFAKYDPVKERLHVTATSDIYKDFLNASWSTDKGITGLSVRKRKKIVMPAIEAYKDQVLMVSRGDVEDLNSNIDKDLKSSITVPVLDEGSVYGVFHLESNDYNTFSRLDSEIIQGLGDLAINLIKISKRNQQYKNKLSKIGELDRLIVTNFNLSEVLNKILEIADHLVEEKIDRSHIALIERHTTGKYLLSQHPKIDNHEVINILLNEVKECDRPYISFCDASDANLPKKREKLGLTQYCILRNNIINATSGDELWTKHYIREKKGINSELVVPIKMRNKAIGVINLESKTINAFTQDDEEIITLLAGQAVIVLEVTNLINNFKQIGKASLSGDRELFIKLVLKIASRLLGTEYGVMWMYNGEQKEFEFGGYHGPFSDMLLNRIFNISSDQIKNVVSNGSINITQISENQDLKEKELKKYFQHLNRAEFKTLICVPLISDNDTIAVMSFYLKETFAFEDWEKSWEKNLIELFATQAALTLSMYKYIKRLTRSVDVQVLENLKKMLLLLTHKLNGSVGGVRSDIKELIGNKNYYNKYKKLFDRILRGCETSLRIPIELENFAEKIAYLDKTPLKIHNIICDIVSENIIRNDITIDFKGVEELPPIMAMEGYIKEVFIELFKNSEKAMPDGGKIIIVGKRIPNKRVSILIRDTGVGIDDGHKGNIFKWNFSIWNKGVGQGKGLAWAKKLVEKDHKGTIKLLKSNKSGTEFEIVLPLVSESH